MEIKKKGKEITIKKILQRGETYKFQKSNKSESIFFFKKPQIVKGYSSKTEDNKHILLLDYDSCDISVVEEDVKMLQEENGLPPAYLFQTKENNYHVVFLSKHSPREIMDLMKYTHIDTNFYDSPLRSKFRSWVLRLGDKKGSKKPKFIRILDIKRKPITDFEISSAHKKLLSGVFPKIIHPNYRYFEDNLSKLNLQEYETA